jgi:serine/threonine protein kinase
MMIRTTCPTDDELRSFGTGRLSGDAVDQVAEHVEACVDCVATISHDGSGSSVSMDPGKRYARRLADEPVFVDRFELLDELGDGSFGYVFKARDTELDRIVALKVQRAGDMATDEDVARFLREARSVAQLSHAAIVSLYESGQTEDGVCYLVTEYVEGQTL